MHWLVTIIKIRNVPTANTSIAPIASQVRLFIPIPPLPNYHQNIIKRIANQFIATANNNRHMRILTNFQECRLQT
jgi:hypothetical protein